MAKPPRLSLDAFKAALQAGEKFEEVAVVRDLPSAEIKAVDGQGAERRVFEFTISTQSPDDDRSNDYIALDGWRLDRYQKNPVVLWAHDSGRLPVGKSPAVWKATDRLRATLDFTQTYDVDPFAAMVCKLVDRGVLNAASVGFQPLVYAFNDKRGGFAMDFIEQELLEWSVVPVPANAESLQGAKSAGVDLAPLKGWAERFLDHDPEAGLWLPKSLVTDDLVAKARAIAAGEPVSVQVPAAVEPPPPAEPTVEDVVKDIKAAAEKAGRVLSAANEATLQQAADSIQAAADSIEAVLSKVAPEDDGDKSAPVVVLELAPTPEPESVVELSADDVQALAETVKRRVHESLILPLTGQLY